MPELQDPDIFRTILESLQTGVYVVGRDGRILFWNQGAEKITGYLRHEALGRFCRENVLAHCNDHNCVQCGVSCPIAGTLHEGKSSQGEIYFRHKKGHRVPVYLRTVAIRDPHGSVIGAAENVKRIVHSSGIQWWGDSLSVTVSLGQAVVQQGDSTESILQRAERALESDASREPAQGKGSNLKGLGTSAS